jgi:hypothetical protein
MVLSVPGSERQKVFYFVREVAGLAFSVQNSTLVLGLPVMATEAIVESPRPEVRPFGILRMPRLVVCGNMSTRQDDGISFNRLIVYDSRMTGRATLFLAADAEGLHMLAMTHDEAHIFYRNRKIAGCDFRRAKDMLMTTQAHL